MPFFITDKVESCAGWAVVKETGQVMGCHVNKENAVDQMVAASVAEGIRPGGERAVAPMKDQIQGSDANPVGSAAGKSGGIELSPATVTGLENKVADHNEAMAARDRPSWTRVTLGALKSVYRRGSGAFSVSHRPGMTRAQWSMGRVNAFLFLSRTGAPENSAYITDNDLLKDDHPRYSSGRSFHVVDIRSIVVPGYMSAAAARGLELRREYGGDGVTDKTIREARLLAAGQMSDDKAVRSNAWAARHAVDLRVPQNNDPRDEGFPGAGAVAHYLWGIDPLDPKPAVEFLARQVEKIKGGRSHNMNVEFRNFDADIVEVRSAESGDGMTFGGFAARYDSPSLPLPFIETIAAGAFDRTLKAKNDVRAYINHDERLILGSTRAKTLRLDNRSDGLYSEIDLPDTSYARDLSVSIARGDTRTMSFGFSTVKDEWTDANNRVLNEVRLHEVSVVTGVAAYSQTTASVRNLSVIAFRTEIDVECLTEAIAALESGEPLTQVQADVLRTVVDRSSPQIIVDDAPATTPIALLMKQLDLIAKQYDI